MGFLQPWKELTRCVFKARRIAAMEPGAVRHFERHFFARVVRSCFRGFVSHREDRILKLRALLRAEEAADRLLVQRFFRARLQKRVAALAWLRQRSHLGRSQRAHFSQRSLLRRRFVPFVFRAFCFKKLIRRASAGRARAVSRRGLTQFKDGVVRSK